MNHNATKDHSILRNVARFHQERARLMADPDIAAQHDACVASHQSRIRELRQLPDYAELFDTITSERLCDLSRMLGDFGTKVFEAGPDIIPEDYHLKNRS